MTSNPKTLLIAAGEDDSIDLAEWNRRRDYWTGIGSFAIAFQGDVKKTEKVTPEILNEYDLVIANLDRSEIPKLRELQSKRNPSVKWVSLIERCATDYLPANPILKELLDGSDLVNVINKHTTGFFRALTTARCEYIGIPYPAESIRAKFFVPIEKRIKRIMLPPYVDPPSITMNASYLAAKGAGLPMYEVRKDGFNYGDANYHSMSRLEPLDYMAFEASSFAFMNLDHRYTQARTVLDCAALGLPCIATRSTGHAEDFFPSLVVADEFCTEEAAMKLQWLNVEGYYNIVANAPLEPFAEMTHERIAEKILTYLN